MTIKTVHFFSRILGCALLIALLPACNPATQNQIAEESGVAYWMTTGDKSSLLAKMPEDLLFGSDTDDRPTIEIDANQSFQTIDGFGYTLTGGSAYVMHEKLTEAQQNALLRELFLRDDQGIGVSYLRLSIGASDLDEAVYSYCDLPVGKTDTLLENFSLAYDTLYLIPILKKVLAINPSIKIMGSPWSPPAWMKTNQSPIGGSLKPEFYATYARYFVKYIQAMANVGIPIDAITLQNEPEHPGNNPSMLMSAENEADFVKNHLGPAFEAAGITTKIIIYDHNCDHPNYPIAILDDPDAKKYIDGSAFHMYLGEIDAMSEVHNAHPDRNLYFTEQWTSGNGDFAGDLRWHVKTLIVGATRNWSRTVLEWNLASDPEFNPHTDQGGCNLCQGALTIGDTVNRNVSYYIIAHAAKFVEPGSKRIASNIIEGLYNVAFLTPSGKKVLIVVNDNEETKAFTIKDQEQMVHTSLPAGGVGTFVW